MTNSNTRRTIKAYEAEAFGLLSMLSAQALNPSFTKEASVSRRKALRRLAFLKNKIEEIEA